MYTCDVGSLHTKQIEISKNESRKRKFTKWVKVHMHLIFLKFFSIAFIVFKIFRIVKYANWVGWRHTCTTILQKILFIYVHETRGLISLEICEYNYACIRSSTSICIRKNPKYLENYGIMRKTSRYLTNWF